MGDYENFNASKTEENLEDQISPELFQRFNDDKKAKEKEIAEGINEIRQAFQRKFAIQKYIQERTQTMKNNFQATKAGLQQQKLEVQDKLVKKKLERERRLEATRKKMELNKINKKQLTKNKMANQNTTQKGQVKNKLQEKLAGLEAELENARAKLLEKKKMHLELGEQKHTLQVSLEVLQESNQSLKQTKQDLEAKLDDLKAKLQGENVCDNSLSQLDRGPLVTLPPCSAGAATESLFSEVSNPMEVEEQVYLKKKQDYLKLKKEIDAIKIEYYQLEDEMSKLKSGSLKMKREMSEIVDLQELYSGEVMKDLIHHIQIIEHNLERAKTPTVLNLQNFGTIVKNNYYLEEAKQLDEAMKENFYLPYKLSKQETDSSIDVDLARDLLKKQRKINQTLIEQIMKLNDTSKSYKNEKL